MNLKMVLASAQLGLVVIGMLTFAYAVYSMHSFQNTGGSKIGKEVVEASQMFLYSELIIQLLQFVVSGLVVYNRG